MDSEFALNKSSYSHILNRFCLDIRFQMVLDTVFNKNQEKCHQVPDLSLSIIFGGLFKELDGPN